MTTKSKIIIFMIGEEKSYSKGKSVVEIEESYHYLEENRLFIDFFFSDR